MGTKTPHNIKIPLTLLDKIDPTCEYNVFILERCAPCMAEDPEAEEFEEDSKREEIKEETHELQDYENEETEEDEKVDDEENE
jgi:hypothetical protein